VLIKLWNFLRGYVKIRMSGFSVERLINTAAASGVIFTDLVRDGVFVDACVSRKDFLRAEEIAARVGATLAAKAHMGLPMLLSRLKKRWVLLLGLGFFVAALMLLTSFIWRIDIVGYSRIDSAALRDVLAQNGFAIGTRRRGIVYRDVESLLMAEFADIAWVGLNITGTRAEIRLIETIQSPEIIDITTPTDIVAAKDGVIISMATSLGTPLFRPGDVVRAGEVLVSGRLAIGVEGEPVTHEYIRAMSEIWARMHYQISFEVPLVFYEKTFTGRVRRVYSIMIGERQFTLPHRRHDFIYYHVGHDNGQLSLGENLPMPLGYTVEIHRELERRLRTRNFDEARLLGAEMVQSRIEEELGQGFDAQIQSKEIEFAEGDFALHVNVFLITVERIDVEQPLQAREEQVP